MNKWWLQLIILIIIWLFLSFIRRKWPMFWSKLHIKRLDILMVVLFVFSCELSVQIAGISFLPFLIFILAVLGIIITFVLIRKDGDILYSKFLLYFWRSADLLILLVYIGLLGAKIFQNI